MTDLHPDLLSVLDAVVIHTPTRFAVGDRIHELPELNPYYLKAPVATARKRALLTALETEIYSCLYIRPAGPFPERPGDDLLRRDRLSALSAANTAGLVVVSEVQGRGAVRPRPDEPGSRPHLVGSGGQQ